MQRNLVYAPASTTSRPITRYLRLLYLEKGVGTVDGAIRMSLTNSSPLEAAREAKSASHVLATLAASARNDALTAIHAGLTAARDDILAANARDLEVARLAAEHGQLSQSLVSRLDLGKKGKWEDMLKGILDVRDLEDPGESASPSYIQSYTTTST